MRTRCAGVIAIVSALLLPSASVAATCESLTGLAVKNGTVTMAHTVAPGAFTPPAGRAGAPGNTNVFARLGGFCRVAVTLKPAPRSDIKGEVWMPSSGWNGRLQVVGNGGFAGTIWFSQALSDPAGALSREKLTLVHEAVLNACDALDGARDGVLENPLACTFDPKVLACKAGSDPASCLTDAQVTTVQKVYAGPSNSRTGKPIYVGLERGSEPGWNRAPVGYAVDYFKYIVFKDPNWDPKALNYDRHVAQAATGDNLIFDANDANMSAFTRRGGKLLLYQGWGEPGIPPANLVRYYGEIQSNTSNASKFGTAVHGSRHGPLRRRHRRQHVRHGHGARSVGHCRQGSSADPRFARAQWRARSHASTLRVSADRNLQRVRQSGRGDELCMWSALTARDFPCPRTAETRKRREFGSKCSASSRLRGAYARAVRAVSV